jgi:acyl-CoA synthetase (AMP-forming)/AMP-acid ligase II
VARLRYTSGTTGGAKAAILAHRVYQASLDNLLAQLHPLSPEDRVLHAAPLTHASGALVYPILMEGGANVVMEKFDAESALELIERLRVTTMFVVPTILQRLAAAPGFQTRDLSSLRSVFYGGAPMAPDKLLPVIGRLGRALVHIYGMTEAPWPITVLGREEHYPGNPRLGSIGRPTAICELRIVGAEGEELPDGGVGEIQVRGRNVMSGYWQDPEATALALREGWLGTGDLGRRDSGGYYYLVDRKKDVIISGGFNVYAQEVELALAEHPGVAEAAVVGFPSADWGETVAAYVVPRPRANLTVEEIDAWARRRLADYKRPRRVILLEELPKNPAGKVVKSALASQAAAPRP